MPLTQEEKDYITDKVVDILKSPDKKERIENLRQEVLDDAGDEDENAELDEAVYAVIQAIEELYG